MPLTLLLSIKQVYGKTLYYPENDTAQQMALFIGQKTFTAHQVKQLKIIGFNITYTPNMEQI